MSYIPEFRLYQYDHSISVFEFKAMDRRAADGFAKVVRAAAKQAPTRLRVVYDFSCSSPPTPYFLKIQTTLYNEFPHPSDEKTAYVVGLTDSSWIRILRSTLRAKDTMRIFKRLDEALLWLKD